MALSGTFTDQNRPFSLLSIGIRANTTNTNNQNVYIQTGWGFVTGAGTNSGTKSETFPTAYTTILNLIISPLSAKAASDPTLITDFNAAFGNDDVTASFSALSATGFTAQMAAENGRTLGSGTRYGYSWIAIGTI